MIIEYHRPTNISEALSLLARKQPPSYPLGGGTVLNQGIEGQVAVVDLQSLGLGNITHKEKFWDIGATVTLQTLLEINELPSDLKKAVQLEATYNLRQMATVAGKLVTTDGRSPFATAMLALDASLEVLEHKTKPCKLRLGDWLSLRESISHGKLISAIHIPINVRFAYEYIARSPADLPIVCAAVTQWESGRTRLVLGGWGKFPSLVMDGPGAIGMDTAARSTCSSAEDEWASAEYRQEMAAILSQRCIKRINST